MSEILFPHHGADRRGLRLRLALAGLAGVAALGLLAGVLALQTLGTLSGDVRLTVQLTTVGDTLGINSDVKYQGLRVGRVVRVEPVAQAGETGWDGPTAEVLVDPDHAALIPGGVRARVLPGTLFGNEYVDLVAARGNGAASLADGAVVPADTSRATLRLMDTFSATQRLLAAVDPAQWDVALSQLADSLDGRGARLATLVRDGEAFLGRWTDLQPQLRRDLDLLTRDSDLLADVEPQLVSALRDSRPLARTLVSQEKGTRTLLRGISRLLSGEEGVTAFLRENGDETARLLNATAANLEVFADRYPAFASLLDKLPALLRNGANAAKDGRVQMEGVLAPQLMDPYDATNPDDCPTYRGLRGSCGGGAR
ncbi:MCE family protein [Nocardioides sp. J54]|uniref:MCE family protein n=1 Tax=Nocardioides sp. J54 TaxID=935866 RepID=UPI0004914703|nr:MCE family protein [Nocardioides sp. J54]